MTRWIYFAQIDSPGHEIKIGLSAAPRSRLAAIQTNIPYEVRLLGLIADGTRDMELSIHRQFSHLWIRGEWFVPGDDLMRHIRELPRIELPGIPVRPLPRALKAHLDRLHGRTTVESMITPVPVVPCADR